MAVILRIMNGFGSQYLDNVFGERVKNVYMYFVKQSPLLILLISQFLRKPDIQTGNKGVYVIKEINLYSCTVFHK